MGNMHSVIVEQETAGYNLVRTPNLIAQLVPGEEQWIAQWMRRRTGRETRTTSVTNYQRISGLALLVSAEEEEHPIGLWRRDVDRVTLLPGEEQSIARSTCSTDEPRIPSLAQLVPGEEQWIARLRRRTGRELALLPAKEDVPGEKIDSQLDHVATIEEDVPAEEEQTIDWLRRDAELALLFAEEDAPTEEIDSELDHSAGVDRDTWFTEDSELDSPSFDSLLSVYGSSMPILYCYDDITWDSEFGSGSASRPNLLYSSDFLCAYDSIRWDTPEADDSSTSIVSETKPSLFLLYDVGDIDSKWYRLSLTSEGENTSDKEVITSLLQDGLVSCELSDYSSVSAIDSTVYRIVHTESSASSHLEFLNTDDLSWKDIYSLSKVRIKPWIISMGKKIFVLGAEAYIEDGSLHELSDIEVFDLHTRQRLPLISIKIPENWYHCFVVASESLNKIIIGSCDSRSLYLYDVCTCQLEQLDLGYFDICWNPMLPPAVVGNILFWFFDVQIVAYDLLDRCFWEGTIDDIDLNFLSANCDAYVDPMLINLGGGALCLICYKSVWPKTTIHCCVFNVPEFTTKSGRPSLHGRVSSTHKFNINYSCCLSSVLLI